MATLILPHRRAAAGLLLTCLMAGTVSVASAQGAAAVPATASTPAPAAPSSHFGMLEEYCSECHNSTDWAGGVAFDTLTEADVPQDTRLWEGAVRKLRGHLMPPPGSKQP